VCPLKDIFDVGDIGVCSAVGLHLLDDVDFFDGIVFTSELFDCKGRIVDFAFDLIDLSEGAVA